MIVIDWVTETVVPDCRNGKAPCPILYSRTERIWTTIQSARPKYRNNTTHRLPHAQRGSEILKRRVQDDDLFGTVALHGLHAGGNGPRRDERIRTCYVKMTKPGTEDEADSRHGLQRRNSFHNDRTLAWTRVQSSDESRSGRDFNWCGL